MKRQKEREWTDSEKIHEARELADAALYELTKIDTIKLAALRHYSDAEAISKARRWLDRLLEKVTLS